MKCALNNNSTFRTSEVRTPSQTSSESCNRTPHELPDFDRFGTGIDKLNTVVRSFSVPDARRLNLDTYGRKAGEDRATQRPLFTDEQTGEVVEGRRAYFNGQGYGLNIDSRGMQVVCSPSKILHPNRPYLLVNDPDGIATAYDVIRQRIQTDTGILMDYSEASVCRLDIAQQKLMNRPVRNYAPAFQLLKLKGSREQRRNYGEQTWNFNSTKSAHQFSFYDKLTEYLTHSGTKFATAVPDSPYLRAELRLLKADYIRKATGTAGTFMEILNGGTELFSTVYNTYIDNKLFTGNYEQEFSFNTDRLNNLFTNLQRNCNNRYLIKEAALIIGVRDIVDCIGLDNFLQVASNYVADRTIRRQRLNILKQAQLSSKLFEPIETTVLLNELRTAFLKAA
jgi:hypothetical protein